MDNLPPELLRIIASFLDVNSRRRILRLASTRWFNAVHYDDFIFYYTTNEQLPLILRRLQRYSHPIGITFDKAMFTLTKQNIEEIGRLTHLTKLCGYPDIEESQSVEDLHPLTKLTSLEEITLDLPADIMYHYSNIKRIYLRSYGSELDLDLTRFSRLESVRLFYPDPNQEPIFSPFEIPSAHLTYLRIDWLPSRIDERDLTKLSKLKHLVLGCEGKNLPHLPNLESLSLTVDQIYDLSHYKDSLTSLTLKTEIAKYTTLETLTKLRKLQLDMNDFDIDPCHSMQFLTALTNLENFVCNPANEKDWKDTLALINSKNLTTLEVANSMDIAHITKFGSTLQTLRLNEIDANIKRLKYFTALTRLRGYTSSTYIVPIINLWTNLRALDLDLIFDWNEWTNPEHVFDFKKMTALEELVFRGIGKRIDDSIQHLRLTKLCANWEVTDKFLQSISKMTTLKEIRLEECKHLSDKSLLLITRLTNLTALALCGGNNTLTGVTLTRLTSLRKLECRGLQKLKFDSRDMERHLTRLFAITIEQVGRAPANG